VFAAIVEASARILQLSIVLGAAAGGAAYGVDGNITGSVWLNLGYNDAYTAIVQRIEARCVAFTNACFQQSRMAGEVSWVALTNGIQAKQQAGGYVVTATASGVGGITVYARQPQIFSPNGGWVAAFAF